MTTMPIWALALTYWLHLLATVLWLGSLSAVTLLVLPAARRSLDTVSQSKLLEAIQRRLEPLGWFSLALLLVTGMFQMSANPNYEGFLAFSGLWATSILAKHIFFLLMILVSATQTWWLLPKVQWAILRQHKTDNTEELAALHKKEVFLLNLNLMLAILILGMTALARAV